MKFLIEKSAHNMLLREFLLEKLRFSRRFIKKLTSESGRLLVNKEPVTVRYVLKLGDELTVVLPEEKRSASLRAQSIPLEIVYEDDFLLVVNKRAGMPSIPSQLHPSGTVVNGILAYYDEKKLPYTAHIVTRLDRNTSGLLLIAKHQYSHYLLSEMQKRNEIKRKYDAIVHGVMERTKGTIDRPIARKADSIIERIVSKEGKRAVTHYEIIRTYNDCTHVGIELETGRTHQIRVHFSSIGHPLVGDDLYGGSLEMLQRQALHCSEISFIHPITNEQVNVFAPLPEDLLHFLSNRQ